MRVRVLRLVLGAAIFGSFVTACGPSEPKRVLSGPPAPAVTGSAVPFTPVPQPVDLAKFDDDPCGLLTGEQVAAVVTDPPDDVKPRRLSNTVSVGCAWNTWRSPLVTVEKPIHDPLTLTELKNTGRRKSGAFDPWTEVSVAGLPAVVFHEMRGPDNCDVAVGVTDDAMLIFSFHGNGSTSTYWDKDRCGGVLKTAEFVIGNLRNR
ncbi:DUF3558 domain-containing protein [Amycolatopsis sp. NPDC051128]|uniref:DUF3558 domain-containing protein n=1 Tax=Amycolatopsis sp. NPDC051128 TaxID=3155412 RepID=UPI0034488B97